MSIRVLSQVWLCDLPPNDLLVMMAIGDCADDDFLAHPSWSYLAWKTGLSRATVWRIVRAFRESGALVPHNSMGNGTVVYRVDLDGLPKKKSWRSGRAVLSENRGESKAKDPVSPRDGYPSPCETPPRLPLRPPPSQALRPPPSQTAIRNKEEPSLNRHGTRGESVESFPQEPLPQDQLVAARRVIELLGIPKTDAKVALLRTAIEAEVAFLGCEVPEAADGIYQAAKRDRARGVLLDRWYFEDAKWRTDVGSPVDQKTREWNARVERERAILEEREDHSSKASA